MVIGRLTGSLGTALAALSGDGGGGDGPGRMPMPMPPPPPPDAAPDRASAFAARLPSLPPGGRRLYLLRHGQTDWNLEGRVQGGGHDTQLNARGRDQAGLVAEELAAVPLDLVASSHLARAGQTAAAVAALHPAARRWESAGFGEMRFGELEGRRIHGTSAEVEEARGRFEAIREAMAGDPSVPYPGDGGESTLQVEERARTALADMVRDHPDARHLAVVGHGRMNKVLLSSLLYDDASRFSPIRQGNTCINVVDFDPDEGRFGTWTEVLLNYVAHTEDRGAASGGRS